MSEIRQAESIKELRSVYDMISLKGKVALMDIKQQEERLKENVAAIKKRYGAEAIYVLGDVTSPESVQNFVDETVRAFGTIDILHNNTGIGYASTKAAVRHMTDAMAIELAPFGIRCNSVCYGFILSGMHENMNQDNSKLNELYDMFASRTPAGFIGQLSDAVGCVVYLASDLSRFATGSTVVVDGGFTTV